MGTKPELFILYSPMHQIASTVEYFVRTEYHPLTQFLGQHGTENHRRKEIDFAIFHPHQPHQ